MMNRPRLRVDELMQSIFDSQRGDFTRIFEEWLKSSKRFRAFAEQYHEKIRKKYRVAQGEDGLQSLLFELQIAYSVLQDERCTLEYEKYAASKRRGPDFTIAFRVNTLINLEVTRIRPSAG